MQSILEALLSIALFAPVLAQSGAQFTIHTQTAEDLLLQKAGQAPSDAGKIAAYESFIAQHPQHPGVIYAWNQIQPLHLKLGALDKVIAGAVIILAAEPDNSPAAYNALQAAEQKLDVPAIILWANRTIDAAKKAITSKKPTIEANIAAWAANVDYAKQVVARCEYSFYASALKVTSPASIATLYEALEKTNPQSQYLPMAAPRYFIALVQQKDLAKAQSFVETSVARNQANEDMLLFGADANLTAKNYDKAIAYSTQITSSLPSKPAPEGVAAAEWEAKKTDMLARSYWMAGIAAGAKTEWLESEKFLGLALPLIEAGAQLKDLLPATYFYLGLANSSLSATTPKPDQARRAEARKYFTLCAALPGRYQDQAAKNLAMLTSRK